MGRFFQAYSTKNKINALQLVQRILHSSWIINIPDELLLSRARFRLLMNATKLNLKLYIYKLSEFRGGYTLSKATKSFSKDATFSLSVVIDRDTYGMPGSPSIVDVITNKIAKSDVFVCDITIINSDATGRRTPNPNVLFELGYASFILGWERIIMIQNIAFGDTSNLPERKFKNLYQDPLSF